MPSKIVENFSGAEIFAPLMEAPTVTLQHCAWCGRNRPLNQHHIVFRSRGGSKGPTITLCGMGNAGGCHGKAHSGRLHFKFEDGDLWGLETEPMKYQRALETEGWRRIEVD